MFPRPPLPGRGTRPIRLVLQYGLAIWAVAMLVVWGSAAAYLHVNQIRTAQQVRGAARAVAATAAATAAADMASPSRWPELLAPAHAAAQQPDVAFVRFRDPRGGIIVSAGNPAVPAEDVWVESVPITYFNEPQGSIEVGMFRAAGAQVLGQWSRLTWLLSLGATLLSAAIAFLVAARIVQPIRLLQQAAAHWEDLVELDLRQIEGPIEVVQLATSVLEMRSQALAKRQELEALVEVRTAELSKAYSALEESFVQAAAALARALDARDAYTARHSSRVSDLVVRMAAALNYSDEELRNLVLAANLHDLGKIGIPESILLKPGRLTPEERAVMQTHSVIGANILAPVPGMAPVARLVRSHHEHWDGGGYPDHLVGTAIPLGSRIIAVADALEAMCAYRPYRNPLPPEVALAELRRYSGTQFDPHVVEQTWPLLVETVNQWRNMESRNQTTPPVSI